MGKLKLSDKEFNIDELDVEYEESEYEEYTGGQPPTGTVLSGGIKKMWWTYTANDDPMIKMLWVASGNSGETAQYNGLPVWDNIVFTPKAAFKYSPFLQVLGLTLKQVKTQLFVADEDDNVGAPIEKIGKVEPGTESTECGIIAKRRKWNGEWQVNIGKLIEQPEADEDDEEEAEEEAPKRSRRSATESRGVSAKKPAATRRKTEPEPEEDEEAEEAEEEDDDDDEEEEAEEEKPAPKRRTPAKKPTTSRRRKPDDDDDEEPF